MSRRAHDWLVTVALMASVSGLLLGLLLAGSALAGEVETTRRVGDPVPILIGCWHRTDAVATVEPDAVTSNHVLRIMVASGRCFRLVYPQPAVLDAWDSGPYDDGGGDNVSLWRVRGPFGRAWAIYGDRGGPHPVADGS